MEKLNGKNLPSSVRRNYPVLSNTHNDADEIIHKPPGWITRFGIGSFSGIILLTSLLLWVLKYPEYIEAKVVISSPAPPLDHLTNKEGFIKKIYLTSYAKVSAGDPIVYIGFDERIEDIKAAVEWAGFCLESAAPPPENLQTGSLAAAWFQLCAAWENYRMFQKNANPGAEIAYLQNEKKFAHTLDSLGEKQNILFKEETAIAHSDYLRNKTLLHQEVISRQQAEVSEQSIKRAERQNLSAVENRVSNQMRINQIEKEQWRLKRSFFQQNEDLYYTLKQTVAEFKTQYDQWDKLHIVRANAAGHANLAQGLHLNQYLEKGTPVATLVQDTTGANFIALCKVSEFGAGKVNLGNPIRISLNAFPALEWGYIESVVTAISPTPSYDRELGAYFPMEARIGPNLRTDTGKIPPFQQNIGGFARITTKHQRLLFKMMGRIYESIEKFKSKK